MLVGPFSQQAPQRVDSRAEVALLDDDIRPEGGQQLGLLHQPIAMLDQVQQRVEDPRGDGERLGIDTPR